MPQLTVPTASIGKWATRYAMFIHAPLTRRVVQASPKLSFLHAAQCLGLHLVEHNFRSTQVHLQCEVLCMRKHCGFPKQYLTATSLVCHAGPVKLSWYRFVASQYGVPSDHHTGPIPTQGDWPKNMSVDVSGRDNNRTQSKWCQAVY